MITETAILVTISTALASGILKDLCMKAIDAGSESSTVTGLTSAYFKASEPQLRLLQKELSKLDSVLCGVQRIDHTKCDQNRLVLLWLERVKEAAFVADNLFDEITYEKTRKQVSSKQIRVTRLVPFKHLFDFRLRVARKVNEFMSLTAEIYKEAENTLKLAQLVDQAQIYQPTSTISADLRELRENPDTSIVLGRQADEDLIVNKLCGPTTDHQLPVIAIVGRSGLGKTTLARMVYDNKTVGEHFGKRTWIFVSDYFNLKRFLDEMLQSVTGQSHNLSNISAMEDKLQQSLQEEKRGYLLVLDDVLNTDEELWKSVESSLLRITRSTKSRVLATTQNSDVVSCMRASPAHELKDLSDADAWELFNKIAFANKTGEQVSDLEDVGRRILSKCKGLPLAVRTMGSMLGSMNKKSEWESVERSEIWGLSVGQSKIMPWLLLSFHHLPDATIKQCFVHCSIIVEKGTFVRQSELIQGWMAQGLIDSTKESGMSMEDIGEACVRVLLSNGLLQMDLQRDIGRDGCYLWMHDLVHDLACFISKDTRLIAREACELHNAYEVEHMRILGSGSQMTEYNLPKGKMLSKLRTLICTHATLSVDFAAQAMFLHDLRLIDCGMKKVPSSIGRLKHLKYLNLRGNKFSSLPESIGTLFNLQMIDLRECCKLFKLPRAITLLVNLRHIFYSRDKEEIRNFMWSQSVKMPEGMEQLACLRTMPAIQLKGKAGFQVKELRSLPLLCGDIGICGLEHISCKEDAVEASLIRKAGITNMRLEWSEERQETDRVNDEEIMEGLQPHSNLKRIRVEYFGGKRFSSWISDMKNLKLVELLGCTRCEKLPTLGQLGCLEEIALWEMASVEVIGIEFYYNGDGERRDNDEMSKITLFPRLKTLRLVEMDKLRDWVEPSGSIYELFPCLELLLIVDCPSLIRAPTCFPSLKHLRFNPVRSDEAVMTILTQSINLTILHIGGVEQLTSLSRLLPKCTLLKSLSIHNCKELRELCPTLQCMPSLETIDVLGCDSLTSFPDIEGLSSLRDLSIQFCENLSTLPSGLESCVSLETLKLDTNAKLDFIPDLRNLTRLTLLTLSGFSRQMSIPGWLSELPMLYQLKIGALNEELEEFCDLGHLPKSLKRLGLVGWPKLKSLPRNLQLLNHLQVLFIKDFGGLETLPEWLGELSCLEELQTWYCEKLTYLPSLDAMRRLTQLRRFQICRCPLLKKRCREKKGKEWPKISHLSLDSEGVNLLCRVCLESSQKH